MLRLLRRMLLSRRGSISAEIVILMIAATVAAAVLILLYVRAERSASQSISAAGNKTIQLINNITV